jgi:hypothetical protein
MTDRNSLILDALRPMTGTADERLSRFVFQVFAAPEIEHDVTDVLTHLRQRAPTSSSAALALANLEAVLQEMP